MFYPLPWPQQVLSWFFWHARHSGGCWWTRRCWTGPEICRRSGNKMFFLLIQLNILDIEVGICGGSVCRVVASDTRDPRFKSQNRQNFICQLHFKIKKKRPGMAHLWKSRYRAQGTKVKSWWFLVRLQKINNLSLAPFSFLAGICGWDEKWSKSGQKLRSAHSLFI